MTGAGLFAPPQTADKPRKRSRSRIPLRRHPGLDPGSSKRLILARKDSCLKFTTSGPGCRVKPGMTDELGKDFVNKLGRGFWPRLFHGLNSIFLTRAPLARLRSLREA